MPETVKAWALLAKFTKPGFPELRYWQINASKALAHNKLRAGIWIIDKARAEQVTNCVAKRRRNGELEGTFDTPNWSWTYRIYPIDAEKD
jgi:hypothetical protein